MTLPSVLVLLAAFNGADHLDAQLRTIRAQIGVQVQVLARDDGSSDETRAILGGWAARHPDFLTLLPAADPSGSASLNFFKLIAAADHRSYDFIGFADQDDLWFPDKLLRAVAAMRESGAGGYSSDLIAHDDGSNRAWMLHKAGREAPFDYLFQGASAGCTYVLTSQAAQRCQAALARARETIDRHISHDWAVYAICRSHGIAWHRDAHARLVYRQHGGNLYGAGAGLNGLRQRRQLVADRWYRGHILWLRNIIVGHPGERLILDALERNRWRDRLMLARRTGEFRRTPRGAALLAAGLLAGRI